MSAFVVSAETSERPKVVSAEISAETEISAMPAETESKKAYIFGFSANRRRNVMTFWVAGKKITFVNGLELVAAGIGTQPCHAYVE